MIGTDLLSTASVKSKYRVDHYWLPLGSSPVNIVENTRYWFGLFSHRRDRVWKGMLCVPLGPIDKDDEAREILAGTP